MKLALCKDCQPVILTTNNQALLQYQQYGYKQTLHDMTTALYSFGTSLSDVALILLAI